MDLKATGLLIRGGRRPKKGKKKKKKEKEDGTLNNEYRCKGRGEQAENEQKNRGSRGGKQRGKKAEIDKRVEETTEIMKECKVHLPNGEKRRK